MASSYEKNQRNLAEEGVVRKISSPKSVTMCLIFVMFEASGQEHG